MTPRFALSLRTRGLILILLIVAPISLWTLYTAYSARETATATLRTEAVLNARLIAATHSQVVENARNFLIALSQLPTQSGWDLKRCAALLARMRDHNPSYLGFAAHDVDGYTVCASRGVPEPRVNIADRSYFQHVIETRGFAIGNYQIGRVSGVPSIPFAYPTLDRNGEIEAIWVAVVEAGWLSRLADEMGLPGDWIVLLTNANGEVLTRIPDPERHVGATMPEPERFRAAFAAGDGVFDSLDVDGVPRIFGFKTVGSASGGFAINVGVPIESALAGPNRDFLRSISFLAAVAAAALAVAWTGARRSLLRPVAEMLDALRTISGGDFATRIGPPYRRSELGALARGLDAMAAALERRERERRDAERRLRASEARYGAFFQHTAEGIFVLAVAPDGLLAFEAINPALAAASGIDAETVAGRTVTEAFPPEAAATLLAHCRACLRDKAARRYEDTLRLTSGTRTWETIVAPVLDDERRIVRLIGSVRDITDRKEVEATLHQAQKMEAIGQLTGGVAHDFNNLLTVIIGSLDRLRRRLAGNDANATLVGHALMAAERGALLNRQLLAFARRQALQPEPIRMNDLISTVEELIRRTLGERIEIEVVRGAGLWPTLADRTQVESALLNLAVNARDAMPDGGRLTIETANAHLGEDYAARHAEATAGEYVLLAVTDTGCGMPPEVLARAFEPFYTTKGEGKGTGLGLSMVYGFAKQSGGHVKIDSEPGHGTSVKVYLPRAARQRPRPAPAGPRARPRGDETVLVVEDDAEVRAVAVDMLTDLGYRVVEAANAAEALAVVEGGAPVDLLFTDVIMPGTPGVRELARRARRRRPELKVLFTSGYTENAILRDGRLDDDVQLLSKPYTQDDLARKVRAALNQPVGGGIEPA